MSLDAKILELRLLIKESSLGQASVSKCAAKLNAFGKNLNDKSALEGFLREVLMYQLDYEKTEKTFNALSRQASEYDVLEQDIAQKISSTKDNIARLEEELQQQKCIREHRVECEKAASIVNQLPSRSTLKRKIDAVNQNVITTNASIELVESEIAQKQHFFKAVMQAISDLQKAGTAPVEEDRQQNTLTEIEDVADGNEDEERDDNRNARSNKEDTLPEDSIMELDEDGNPIEPQEDGEEGEGDDDTENADACNADGQT
eukprot:CAMPEP_0170405434 /NCGR_PEP_ID=MMETSP0117_2-20130122/27177_1 /TAXON_ID=400756 /ORGANISM="Durinskia baltica, Strain CSIRO CS-38" /LENGTH=259 /DNA_ID=CAMNT_0010662545 /DNA_START=12 /DNA_END=791 /DNA_ORIENTATION=+